MQKELGEVRVEGDKFIILSGRLDEKGDFREKTTLEVEDANYIRFTIGALGTFRLPTVLVKQCIDDLA